jgi:hypothetical protein
VETQRTKPRQGRTWRAWLITFLPAIGITLAIFVGVIAGIMVVHGSSPFEHHRVVTATIAPMPDPAYERDSLLARQILAQGGPHAGDLPIVNSPGTVHPLDAGTPAAMGDMTNYRCNLPNGGLLSEVRPDNHGRIVVIFNSVNLVPVLQTGITVDCLGGEVLLLSPGQLDAISGR